MFVKKNDTVEVIYGKDRGKRSKVIEILPNKNKLRLENLQMVKKHLKPNQNKSTPQGGIIDKPALIDASNIMVVCPSCSQTTRIGRRMEDNFRIRYCRKCDHNIE